MAGQRSMCQEAPYPEALASLVDALAYKDGWKFWLQDLDRGQGSKGLTLVIQRYGPDTYHPDQMMRVNHFMPVPPAAFNRRSWRRWLFDQFLLVEQHEAAEFFQVGGERPYAPLHGPGNSPYLIAELADDEDRRTSFRGELNPGSP